MPSLELVPIGEDARDVRPGDYILCHRKGFVSACIRFVERLRNRRGAVVSHAAFCETPDTLIEALTRGVVRTPLSAYRHVEYWIARTDMSEEDQRQAVAFARSCVGQRYGWFRILAMTGRVLFGRSPLDGTEICSGLVALTQVRGWANFATEPAMMTPSGLFEHAAATT